jgi:hypothetical protein
MMLHIVIIIIIIIVVVVIIIIIIIISGMRLSSLGTAATTGPLYQLQMIDDGDCGAIGGMKIGRGKCTQRKPAPAPLCQIPLTTQGEGLIECFLCIYCHGIFITPITKDS